MSEFTFSCPDCAGYVACDDSYSGYQIECPLCQVPIVVPDPSEGWLTEEQGGAAASCPSCGAGMDAQAVLCTSCGYNIETGQHAAAGQPRKKRKKKRRKGNAAGGASGFLQSEGGQATILGVFFGGLYAGSMANDIVAIVFLGFAALYSLAVWIYAVVEGFRDEPMAGVLNLICCWPYTLYFVYGKSDNGFLKAYYSINIVLNLAIQFTDFGIEEF